MAVPTIVGSAALTGAGANASDTTVITAPVPAGTQDGDILIFIHAGNSSSTESYLFALNPETPSQWTAIGDHTASGTMIYQAWAAVYSATLDKGFRGNLALSRRVLPVSVTIRGSVTPDQWVLGIESRRADNGTDTTTVAQSITALANDTLALGLFVERTTTAETDVTSVTGATKYAFHYDATSTSIETATITHETLISTQASGDTTVTYPNVQLSNGIGQLIGIPATIPPDLTPQTIGYLDQSSDGTTSVSSIVLNPSTPTAGTAPIADDWLVAVIAINNNSTAVVTPPAGWMRIDNNGWATVGTYSTYVYAHKYQAGDSSYTFSFSAACHVNTGMFWVRGAADVYDWTIGPPWKRGGTTVDQYRVISQSLTAPYIYTLVCGLAFERTTASEIPSQITVAETTKWFSTQQFAASNSITTISVANKSVSIATSGDVTFTYPNLQTVNGWGYQLGIPASSSVPPAGSAITIASDTFARTEVSGWGSADIGALWTTTAGTATVSAGHGHITLATANTSAGARLAYAVAKNVTVSTTASVDKVLTGSNGFFIVRGRISPNIGDYRLKVSLNTDGSVDAQFVRDSSGTDIAITTATAIAGVTYTAGSYLKLKFDISGASPTTLKAKIWRSVDAEPVGWNIQTTDSTATLQGSGQVGLGAALNTSVTNYPVDMSFDTFLATSPTEPGAPISAKTAGGVVTGYMHYVNSAGLQPAGDIKVVTPGYSTVANMLAQNTFYVAHRGGSRSWPEMSLHAYTQSVVSKYGAIELSLARTSDGVWFGLHDQTLDRTSGVSGVTASSITWAQVQSYQILGSMATDYPTQPNRPYMSLDELLSIYYPSHVIFIDPKYQLSNRTEMFSIINALPGTPQNHIVIKYYGVEGNTAGTSGLAFDAANLGYERWGYFYQADAANFATYQGRWSILGMDYNADQPTWDAIKSYAKPVIGHICPNQTAADTALIKGANGLMVSGVAAVPAAPIV